MTAVETVDQILAARSVDQAGLSRMLKWSFGVHFGVVLLAIVIPRDWLATDRTEPEVMTISLGAGAPGERTGGMSAAGARTVEQVEPPPPRPVPVTPATAPRPTSAGDSVSLPTPPQAPPKPAAPVQRPPTTGAQVQTGSSAAETGATQDAAGISFGGGGGTAMVSANFCCPWYFEEMLARIQGIWRADLPGVRGNTVVEYTIRRDGTIVNQKVLQSSGFTGDLEAQRSLRDVRLSPIPQQVEENEIVVRLRFPYGGGA